MNRVVVLGCPGAGKSQLSVALGHRLGLDVVHLDRLYYRPGWTEISRAEFRDAQRRALPRDGRWIADGNYVNTLEVRLPLVDTVILLDLPTGTCLRRVIVRTLTTTTRPDMAPGCEEHLFRSGYFQFLRYVARFRSKMLPRVLTRIDEIDHSARVVVLRRAAEVSQFLRELSPARGRS